MPNEPSRSTVKRLFAFSRNRCAFPECVLPIVENSGTVTGIICHICARSSGGPRYNSKQTPEERHAFENLILMCGRHSKVIDSEPKRYTPKLLSDFKRAHEQPAENELSIEDGRKIDFLISAYRDIYINTKNLTIEKMEARTVVFQKSKGPIISAPDGSIGSDLHARNYSKHLIDQYNDFAYKQPNRKTRFSFASIHSFIKKRYAVGKWELVPTSKFSDLCEQLQRKIDGTWLGKINTSKGIKNYSTFSEYLAKYSGS